MNETENILKKIEDHENRLLKLESFFNSKTEGVEGTIKKFSEREFLKKIKPTSAVEITLALSYYLEKYNVKTSFNLDDLRSSFKAAKEPSPENLNDKLNKNIKKGLLMETRGEDKNKKYWELTKTGLESIEEKLKT